MIDPKRIPDEAMEAAKAAFLSGEAHFTNNLRAAIAAALAAWPGAFPHTFRGPLEGTGFVLPLPTEARDD